MEEMLGLFERYGIKLSDAALKAAVPTIAVGWIFRYFVPFLVLGMLMLDWLTGYTQARITKTASSDCGMKGAIKTLVYCLLLGIAVLLVYAPNPALVIFGAWISLTLFLNELTSITENLQAVFDHYEVRDPVLKQIQSGTGKLAAWIALPERKKADDADDQ